MFTVLGTIPIVAMAVVRRMNEDIDHPIVVHDAEAIAAFNEGVHDVRMDGLRPSQEVDRTSCESHLLTSASRGSSHPSQEGSSSAVYDDDVSGPRGNRWDCERGRIHSRGTPRSEFARTNGSF